MTDCPPLFPPDQKNIIQKNCFLRDRFQRPPIYLVRHKDGLRVYGGHADSDEPHVSIEEEVYQSAWSPDGTRLVINSSTNGLVVYKHTSWSEAKESLGGQLTSVKLLKFPNSPQFPARSLRHLQWSPKGKHVVAHWQYDLKAASAGKDERNVLVWNTSDLNAKDGLLQPVAGFLLKGIVMGQWPILKWRNDEKFCLLSSRLEVIVYSGSALGSSPLMRIPVAGVLSTEPAPVSKTELVLSPSLKVGSEGLIFAAFSPAPATGDGTSAFFRIVVIPEVRRGIDEWHLSVLKPLGASDSAVITWSPSGSLALIVPSTMVDAAGENYGSVGDVYLARYDGSLTVKVNKAVAQDAAWNPCRDEFIVIEGKSPSEMYLYDKDCNVQHSFPVAYRNTIRWDPFGSMVGLGGFGNLAGDVSLWYREDDQCMRLIADWREPCTVLCNWSPDGRHFSAASTYPRMKVDNFCKVFDYEGNCIQVKTYTQLLDFQWKPEPVGLYCPPPPPTQQSSAIAAAQKFLTVKDLASDATKHETRRFGLPRKRKDVVQQCSGGTGALTTAGTGKSGTVTATATTAAKMERYRQVDSISDWRAAPKEQTTKESEGASLATVTSGTSTRRLSSKSKVTEIDRPAATTSDNPPSSSSSSAVNDSRHPRKQSGAAQSRTVDNSKRSRSIESTTPSTESLRGQALHKDTVASSSSSLKPPSTSSSSSEFATRNPLSSPSSSEGWDVPVEPPPTEKHLPAVQTDPNTKTVSSNHIALSGDMGHQVNFQQLDPQGVEIALPTTSSLSSVEHPTLHRPPSLQVSSRPARPQVPYLSPSPLGLLEHSAVESKTEGLVSLLRRVLPPDATVHIDRPLSVPTTTTTLSPMLPAADEAVNSRYSPYGDTVSSYGQSDPLLRPDQRQSQKVSRSSRDSIGLQHEQLTWPSFNPNPPLPNLSSSQTSLKVEGLVDLFIRSQKEKISPHHPVAVPNEPSDGASHRVALKTSVEPQYWDTTYPNTATMNLDHGNSLLSNTSHQLSGFRHTSQQLLSPHPSQAPSNGLSARPVIPVGQSPFKGQAFPQNMQPQLLQEFQNRFRNARDNPREQAALLQEFLWLRQQQANSSGHLPLQPPRPM